MPTRLIPLLLLLAMAAGHASARDLLAVGAHFERVFERRADGEFVGLGPDIVRQVARRTKDTVRFELYPWARAQAMVAQGLADILVGPYKSPERLERMSFSRSAFYRDDMVFYQLAGAGNTWQGDYAALEGKPIVAMNGWAYGVGFDAARPRLRVSVANNVENGLLMLTHKHVALFASNRRNTEPVLAALKLGGQVEALAQVIQVQDGYFAFPKRPSHDALRAGFDAAFDAMIESGELKRLGLRHDVDVP
ncbi:transporter substrate-binding domain-containing protein [Pseudoduganella sp. LjRoot289]|uniref:substrate-binding periplasmic protein n=1 Tax=Pseudoduganella sp. LjRoot289 TaxID=3342314 RepID=UPI003ED0799C